MRYREKHFNGVLPKGIKRKWIFTYLLILIIPLVVSTGLFFGNLSYYEKQNAIESQTVLRWGYNEFKAWQDSCYTILNKVIDNSDIYRIINDVDNYNKNTMQGYLDSYKKLSVSVNSVSIYVPEQARVLSSETCCDADLYYLTYKNDGYEGNFEDWRAVFERQYKGEFVILNLGNSSRVLYITSINYASGEKHFNLIIEMNSRYINNVISEFLKSQNSDIVISDSDERVVYACLSRIGMGSVLNRSTNNLLYVEVGDTTYRIISEDSLFAGMKVSYLVPKNEYLSTQHRMIAIVAVTMCWCIVFGIILIYALVKRNYNPIQNILSELSSNQSENNYDDFNEYAYIYDAIKDIVSKNTSIQKQLKRQNILVRNNILLKLIKQGSMYVIPEAKMLEDYDIYFIGERYAMIMFYMEDESKLFVEENVTEQEQVELSRVIIENIITELSQPIGTGYIVDMEGAPVFLMNFEDGKSTDQIYDELLELCKKLKRSIYENFDIRFSMSISGIHTGYNGIRQCLADSLNAMEYRLVRGKDQIIEYRSIASENIFEYQYTIKDEQLFINAIISGDFELSQKTAELIIDKNVREDTNVNQIKLLVFDMVGTLHKAIDEIRTLDQKDQMRTMVNDIITCTTLGEIKCRVIDILTVLCESANDIKDSMQNIIVRHVVEYIGNNYSDISLSVAQLAENNGITPNYLSKIFKDVTGERLLYYIHTVRLNKAKELLINERALTVEQIANKVGYSNTATFNRTFLKFEGVSPTKWMGRNVGENN